MFQCLSDMPIKHHRTKVNLYLEETSYREEYPRAFQVVLTSIDHFRGTHERRFAKGLPLVPVLERHRVSWEEKKRRITKLFHTLWLS